MRGDKINKKRLTRAKNVRIFSICSSSNCFGEERGKILRQVSVPRARDGGGGDGGDGGGGVNHRKESFSTLLLPDTRRLRSDREFMK